MNLTATQANAVTGTVSLKPQELLSENLSGKTVGKTEARDQDSLNPCKHLCMFSLHLCQLAAFNCK